MRSWLVRSWALLVVGGCIQDVGLGPELGSCASVPGGGPYTFGEIDIGTCLAGPADLEFFEQGGATWLAVSNADPYRNFVTGSVLVIPWDDVVTEIESGHAVPPRIELGSLSAVSAVFDDDDALDDDTEGGNPFLGGIGRPAGAEALLVAGRLTENSDLRSGRDELFVIDTSGLPDRVDKVDELLLRDDPFPVVYDPDADLTYVGNLTDHSISLVELEGTDPLAFATVDAATGSGIALPVARDTDVSGSLLELAFVEETARRALRNETYAFTYVSGTRRLFVPTAAAGGTGLLRYDSPDSITYLASGYGLEQGVVDADTGEVDDVLVEGRPFVYLDADGLPGLLLASPVGDDRSAILNRAGVLVGGQWTDPTVVLLSEVGETLSAPSLVSSTDGLALYFAVEDEAGISHVERAVDAVTTFTFGDRTSVLPEADGDLDYEDPYVVFDERARRYRMWLTVEDRTTGLRTIAHAASPDSASFGAPSTVIAGATSVAAPAVQVIDAQYQMWFAVQSAGHWDIAHATSPDGLTWSSPTVVLEDVAPEDARPPRAAVLSAAENTFRVEGADLGRIGTIAAGAGARTDFSGFTTTIVHGHAVSNDIVAPTSAHSPHAKLGLVPVSVVEFGGRTLVYATAVDGPNPDDQGVRIVGCGPRTDETRRIVVLERFGPGSYGLVRDGTAVRDDLGLGADDQREAFAPVVTVDGDELVMIYAVQGPERAFLRRAISTDGERFTPEDAAIAPAPDSADFDGAGRIPHSLQTTADGVRLWYTADSGNTCTIGSMTAPSVRGDFTRVGDAPTLGLGGVGAFDGEGVKDPAPVQVGDEVVLLYAGLLDNVWRIGVARELDGAWESEPDPLEPLSQPVAPGIVNAFSALGTDSPAVFAGPDGPEVLYAGYDGFARRIGYARISVIDDHAGFFPVTRSATAGDFAILRTERQPSLPDFPDTVIELRQTTSRFSTDGEGMSSLTLDSERGFLYVTSKISSLGLADRIMVVDVRDDSSVGFRDSNYRDLEGVVEVDLAFGALGGFRDALVDPVRDVLYLTSKEPDGVAVVDLGAFVDNAEKEVVTVTAKGMLPLPNLGRDPGATSSRTTIGGAGMALSQDARTLIVTHFRGNGVAMFDLELGAFGEEVAWIPEIGENPHLVELSPDGRYAVVANYVGEVEENLASSTLAVLDLDPNSASFREVVAWIVNR